MDQQVLREELCRVGKSLYERGYAHGSAGNISVRLDDGFLITPTDASLGRLDPSRLALLDREGNQLSGEPASRAWPMHHTIYRSHAEARCLIHTRATHLVALSLAGVWSMEDVVPPITPHFVMNVGHVPLIEYHSPGSAETLNRITTEIEMNEAAGVRLRAMLLERQGPIVWHSSLEQASIVLEELEETARIWLLLQQGSGNQLAKPMNEAELQDLRQSFKARW
jgi:ribulose-5-phosphate 4-epimerase/fuculose-1-phosphate aldolase